MIVLGVKGFPLVRSPSRLRYSRHTASFCRCIQTGDNSTIRVATVWVNVWSCDEKRTVPGKLIKALLNAWIRFKVEVVGRLVNDQQVGADDHDSTEHATHLFSSTKHVRFFLDVVRQ